MKKGTQNNKQKKQSHKSDIQQSKIELVDNQQLYALEDSDRDSQQFQDEQFIDNDSNYQQDIQDQYDSQEQEDQEEEYKSIISIKQTKNKQQNKQVKQRANITNTNTKQLDNLQDEIDSVSNDNEPQINYSNLIQTQGQKKIQKKQAKQVKQQKNTKQIKQTTSSQRRKIDDQVRDLINNQFIFDTNITLVYQSDELLTYLVENNGDDFINKLIIDHFRNLYDNICYKGKYIKKCQQLIERSLINCILVRNGKMIYEINSIIQIQHIRIDPFSILNTQVMEINQSHNSQFVLLINKGTEDSNLNIANIFIQLENVSQEAQQIYNQSMQIGQYIPCVAQKIIYHSGQQNITIFASILKKLNFKHIYVFKPNNIINLEILKDEFHKILLAQQEINEDGILKIKQYIELLLNNQLDEKQLQNRLNAQFDIKQFNECRDSNKTFFIEMDLINYIYGSISIIDEQQIQKYQEQSIVINIVEDQHNQILFLQLINRIIKWQLFFIEFVSLNSSAKSFKNLQYILSI